MTSGSPNRSSAPQVQCHSDQLMKEVVWHKRSQIVFVEFCMVLAIFYIHHLPTFAMVVKTSVTGNLSPQSSASFGCLGSCHAAFWFYHNVIMDISLSLLSPQHEFCLFLIEILRRLIHLGATHIGLLLWGWYFLFGQTHFMDAPTSYHFGHAVTCPVHYRFSLSLGQM